MSSDTMTATTDQCWMQFYQQPLMDGGAIAPPKEGFSDATFMIKSPNTNSQLTPKGNNDTNVSKPIRRRSRASKRTPTTLLNANTNNFRALVQQFTGRPSTTTMSSLGVHKGPITLNFKHGSRQQNHHHNTITRVMPQIGSRSDHNQVHQEAAAAAAAAAQFLWQKQPDKQVLPPQQQLFEEQQGQGGYSFDYMNSSNFLPTSDGLVVGNDFSLHDLTSTVNAFSNDTY